MRGVIMAVWAIHGPPRTYDVTFFVNCIFKKLLLLQKQYVT